MIDTTRHYRVRTARERPACRGRRFIVPNIFKGNLALAALFACACCGLSMKSAQAQTCTASNCDAAFSPANGGSCECQATSGNHSILNNSYIVENNAPNGPGPQCILWKSNGSFCVSDITSTNYNYPNLLQGTLWSQDANHVWDPVAQPIKVSAIQNWPVSWTFKTPSSSDTWNALMEFWIQPSQPTGPVTTQPTGTELMIIPTRSANYKPGNQVVTGHAFIDGIAWDVWAFRWGPGQNNTYWNYIAYTPSTTDNKSHGPWQNTGDLWTLNMDVAPFFVDAQGQTGSGSSSCNHQGGLCCDVTNGTSQCVDPNQWVVSVQAGFEIAGAGKGNTLESFQSYPNAPGNGGPSNPVTRTWKQNNPGYSGTPFSIAAGAESPGAKCDSSGHTCPVWVAEDQLGSAQIQTWENGGWAPGAGKTQLVTNDQFGNPWMVSGTNSAVEFWNGTSWQTWNATPASLASFALAVGNPNNPNDIWTIDNSQNVYFNTGTLTNPGQWIMLGTFPPGGSNEIALSSTVQMCGSPLGPVHVPMVTNALTNEIYLGFLNSSNCADISWYDTFGVGFGDSLQPLASDLAVGTDNNLYGWGWSTFGWAGNGPIAPMPAGGLWQIASGPSGIWGLDGNHVPNQLMECVNGTSFCVPYFWNALYN
jgi:hypothetical protein